MISMTTTKGPLSSVEKINARYPLHIRRFAAGQYLSSLAYDLAKIIPLPSSIKVLREDGSFKDYVVKPFPLKKGMYGYILLPEDKSIKDIKVIFRGTDFADPKSIAINLETWGPGSASFVTEEKKIFQTLKQVLHEHYPSKETQAFENLTLDICGHSQGSAFTQLFTNAFLKYRASSSDFDQIKKLNMTALNSPGGPRGLAASTAEYLCKQFTAKKPLKIVANYGMVGGDAVQVTGFDMIFSNLPPELVELNLLKVDKGLEGFWLKAFELDDGLQLRELWDMAAKFHASLHGAHPNVNFYAPIDATGKINVNSRYEYFSNQRPEDRKTIARELGCKAVFTQHSLFFVKMFLYYLLEYKETVSEFSPLSYIKGLFWHTIGNKLSDQLKRWFRSYQTEEKILPQTLLAATTTQASEQFMPVVESDKTGILPSFSKFSKDDTGMLNQDKNIGSNEKSISSSKEFREKQFIDLHVKV